MIIEEINPDDLNALPDVEGMSHWYNMPAGQEHYRLLRYISSHFDLIFDIGTYEGYSCNALCESGAQVETWDIKDQVKIKLPDNVYCNIGNILKESNLFILDAELIFLDTAHDGDFEKELTDFLTENNWKGILIADDIHLNDSMKKWWESLPQRKYDITHLGHWSGTGLVYYE